MSIDLKAISRRVFEGISAGNLAVVDEHFDRGWRFHHDDVPPQPLGPEFLKGLVTIVRNGFPDARWTVHDMVSEGDKVVIRYSLSGTHRGEFRGMAPTGKQVQVNGIAIERFEKGRITESWDLWDDARLLQQLGVSASPAGVAT
jgi:steroid delta-isomerase-like uncharacterized protein